MENFHDFLDASIDHGRRRLGGRVATPLSRLALADDQNRRSAHKTKIATVHQSQHSEPHAIHVHHRHAKVSRRNRPSAGIDPWMRAADNSPFMTARFDQRRAKRGQTVPPAMARSEGVTLERPANRAKRKCQVVDTVQRPNRKSEIILIGAEVMAILFNLQASGLRRKEGAGIDNVNRSNDGGEPG